MRRKAVKEFVSTAVVLVAAVVVVGCQQETEAPAESPPIAPEPVAEEAAPVEEPAQSESAPEVNPLVGKVMGLMQVRTVEETDQGIKITWPLEAAATVDADSPPQVVSDAMMFATFYAVTELYKRLSELDGLQQAFIYKGKTIGDIRMTRESYESLNVERTLQGLPDGKPKRQAYRKMLKQLPKGAVDIEKKYWPRG
jgi:hypothetical protein